MAEPIDPAKHHRKANAAYLEGNYQLAISLQVELVNELTMRGKQAAMARKLLALYLYSNRDFDAAITLLKTLEVELPEDPEVPENIGVMLRQSGQPAEAVNFLLKAHTMAPEKYNVCDGLAHCFHSLGEIEMTQRYGRLSLELKDRQVADARSWEISSVAPPKFDEGAPERNVISFSLFGDKPRYLHGALRNARLAADLYPGWTCRFYVDPKVPKTVLKQLRDLNCQLVEKAAPDHFYEGLLWRFEVIADPTVDRFLVRDCDSVINIKERVAVDQWLESDQWFHMMRDFPSHTEMVLAGMWGGVNGVLPSIQELKANFNPRTAATRTYDQQLLREMVWPTMRKSVLIHDSVYTGCLGSVAFPSVGRLPANRHVGQNEAAIIDDESMLSIKDGGAELNRFFITGLLGCGKNYLQSLLNSHPNAFCPAEQQLGALWRDTDKSAGNYQKVLDESARRNEMGAITIRQKKVGTDLYSCWLEHLFLDYAYTGCTHVGLTDQSLDNNIEFHTQLFPDCRFLFVVRDPRDVAVAVWRYKKRNDPGFDRDGSRLNELCLSLGKEWSEALRNIQSYNHSTPGVIELVRYEDLVDEKIRLTTMKRIMAFLQLPANETQILTWLNRVNAKGDLVEVGAWEDCLPMQQVDLIQKDAHKLMKLLQYELCEIDYRFLESKDTILPS